MVRIGLVCGGPSAERGISLNSACSIMDHIRPLGFDVITYYVDRDINFFKISPSHLYSNTPSDFDFKLEDMANDKNDETHRLSIKEFIESCKQEVDILLPVIHGEFGEDGKLQRLLEENGIPFVGSPSESCQLMFDKEIANKHLKSLGYHTLPNCCLEKNDSSDVIYQKIIRFFNNHKYNKYVVKPTANGSSIGVKTVVTPQEALDQVEYVFEKGYSLKAMIEPYSQGKEFTIVVLQNMNDEPVALIPIQHHLNAGDVLSFRHKYLLSCDAEYYCPPHFSDNDIRKIQKKAERLFSLFKMRDISRIDGWLMPNGDVYFSDFNPITGMEQASILFIQGSHIGLSHKDILLYIISHAAKRYGLNLKARQTVKDSNATQIRVLFGGITAERQVSVLSGLNVWLKLMNMAQYKPIPYLLAPNHEVWQLPYSFTLNHSAEEIRSHCENYRNIIAKLRILVPPICERLGLPAIAKNAFEEPRRMDLNQFCEQAAEDNAFIFNALHGGEGENGRLQALLNRYGLKYNGSDEKASELCMDKYKTGKALENVDEKLISLRKVLMSKEDIDSSKSEELWNSINIQIKTDISLKDNVEIPEDFDILVKPRADGCSTGVARLCSSDDLKTYLQTMECGLPSLEEDSLSKQFSTIAMPVSKGDIIFEPYIEVDKIEVTKDGRDLAIVENNGGWVELTVGVMEDRGCYHSLTPSLTVADGMVLSVEEKFQGGTGINLTPPPENKTQIATIQIDNVKKIIEKVARALGIQGYARIDIFFNKYTNSVIVIEANTLPGLTIATVIYHQALAEKPCVYPEKFLSKIIEYGMRRSVKT